MDLLMYCLGFLSQTRAIRWAKQTIFQAFQFCLPLGHKLLL